MENNMTAAKMSEIEMVLSGMTECPIDMKEETPVELHAHMRGTNLFLPKVRDPRDLDEVMEAIGMGPLHVALNGGGEFLFGHNAVAIPAVNLRDISAVHCTMTLTDGMFEDQRFVQAGLGMKVGDPKVKEMRRYVNSHDVKVSGIALRLKPWMIRLQSAFEATLCGVSYNWDAFFKSYRKDLAEALKGMVQDHVLTTPRTGMQAHAGFDPRIEEDEVGVSLNDYHRLVSQTGHELEGESVILGRYPAAGEHSFRHTILCVLPDQMDGMIYLNAESWRDLHGGDFDGDLAYILIDENTLTNNIA